MKGLSCRLAVLTIVAMIMAQPAWAGPVFNAAGTSVGGPTAAIIHELESGGATNIRHYSNDPLGPNTDYNFSSPAANDYSGTLNSGSGADGTTATGGIGYLNNPADYGGYFMLNLPGLIGVSQTDENDSIDGKSKIKVEFDLQSDINGVWRSPLFAYHLMVFNYNMTGPGDEVTFAGEFTHTLDFPAGHEASEPAPAVMTLGTEKSWDAGDTSGYEVMFDFDFLTFSDVPDGSTYSITGFVEWEAQDPHYSDFSLVADYDLDQMTTYLREEMNFVGLPQALRGEQGFGVFMGNPAAVPEPGTVLLLVFTLASLGVGRRRHA